MVQKHSVYRKSDLGVEALARRDAALALRLRSLLILVDGKRPLEELAKLSPTGPETGQLLRQLEEQGMIERVAPEPAEPASAAPGPIRTQSRTVSLPEAQRAAVRHLTDLLGPGVESLCLRIEAARTVQDLQAALQRAESLVRDARGSEAATAFTERMRAFRPA